jgi:hypothetical protein
LFLESRYVSREHHSYTPKINLTSGVIRFKLDPWASPSLYELQDTLILDGSFLGFYCGGSFFKVEDLFLKFMTLVQVAAVVSHSYKALREMANTNWQLNFQVPSLLR